MATIKLTDSFIRSLKSNGKRTEYYDSIITGLAIRVSPSGNKSFVYRYRADDKVKRYTMGKFPALGLSKARDMARDLAYSIRKGGDPLYEKQKKKYAPKSMYFSELVVNYKALHCPKLKQSTRTEYIRIIDRELLPTFSRLKVEDISRAAIVSVLDSIAARKPTLSNRVRGVMSSIMAFAVDKALIDYNPVLGIKRRAKEVKRERFYSEQELKKIWEAIEEQEEPIQSVFKMLLYCGQRSGETKTARWEDVDLKEEVWVIPQENTKAARRHEVPLSDQVITLLQQRENKDATYVFASRRVKNKPLGWLQKASDRIKKSSGVPDFRIHDLRRTATSYMAKLGVDRTTLGKVINHKQIAGDNLVTAIYDRHNYKDKKRDALQRWADHLDEIVSSSNN